VIVWPVCGDVLVADSEQAGTGPVCQVTVTFATPLPLALVAVTV